MPRPLRPIADGLVYHVINRGNNRQPVFRGESDYVAFLKAIADLKKRSKGQKRGQNYFYLPRPPKNSSDPFFTSFSLFSAVDSIGRGD